MFAAQRRLKNTETAQNYDGDTHIYFLYYATQPFIATLTLGFGPNLDYFRCSMA